MNTSLLEMLLSDPFLGTKVVAVILAKILFSKQRDKGPKLDRFELSSAMAVFAASRETLKSSG